MQFRPFLAFAGAATLAAVAFAPAVTSSDIGADGPRDGLSGAFGAGQVDLDAEDLDGVPLPVGAPCTAGFAGPYPCENIDLASYVPLAELGGGAGSDSWGWVDDMDTPDDTSDDREIALYGTTLGLTYIDITDPNVPLVLGRTTMTPGGGVLWRDVKVYDGHAFFVSEEGGYGVQVIDLTVLRDVAAPTFANEIAPVAHYDGLGNSHNIWINEETARAYVVGTDQSSAGLHILDVSEPTEPTFIGEFAQDGYTHDTECVVYRGPDADYNGAGADRALGTEDDVDPRELCFAANEDSMTVVDVTDATAPVQVSKIKYAEAGYTHQSVLTEDQRWLLWNDETDEGATGPGTRTYWVDASDLDDPEWKDDLVKPGVNDHVKVFTHDLLTVDHNMYITGDILWQANYNGGLQVFRLTDEDLEAGTLSRVGYFDVDPGLDIGQYGGAWNVYPHFPSGNLIVSTLDEGLYVLQANLPEPTE